MLLTGFATVAVGLAPTYHSIVIRGAVLLTLLRLIQGIGVGGEWGGSVLLAKKWSKGSHNRGFMATALVIDCTNKDISDEYENV